MAYIEFKDVSKVYRMGQTEIRALDHISFSVEKGELCVIVGPSGAGKTTLLQIMGTLYRPNAGTLHIAGHDVLAMSGDKLSRFRCEHIGFVFQFHQLLPEFSALENVMMPGLIARHRESEVRRRGLELLDFLGLAHRSNHKPAELSGGEKQRVAVARALMNQPDVILADEPSGSLDSHNKDELHSLFFRLRDEMQQTFIIVTHDEHLATLTDRTIHLSDGRVVTPETPVPTETTNPAQHD